MGRVRGLLKEITGALTGDRRGEARGRAEEEAADQSGTPTDELVGRELREVRLEHGDIPLDDDPDNG